MYHENKHLIQAFAKTTPEKPPIENKKIKAIAKNIGGVNELNHHLIIVAIQLNTFTAVGTAIIIVAALK